MFVFFVWRFFAAVHGWLCRVIVKTRLRACVSAQVLEGLRCRKPRQHTCREGLLAWFTKKMGRFLVHKDHVHL